MSHPVEGTILCKYFPESGIEDWSFDTYGLITSTIPRTLSYLTVEKYLEQLNANSNITGVITSADLAKHISPTKQILIADDPTFIFWSIVNSTVLTNLKATPNQIDPSVVIHATASIADRNVVVGAGTIIEANVTILPDVEIGKNCIIGTGAVIGIEGFERKRTKQGILSIIHDGKVILHDNVEVGALNSIAKGMGLRNTVIFSGTKIDSLVHIAHCSYIGESSIITPGVVIAGSVTVGNRCWLGPNSTILNGVRVFDNCIIGIGSVVTKDIPEGLEVLGNPARIIRKVSL